MRFYAYMTPEDELPLWDFIQRTQGRVIHIFSAEWPPVPLVTPPAACAEDECLGIWYAEVISGEELRLPACHPARGPHGCFDAWGLPLITFQRQWYWKRQPTIFAIELDYRAFRPNRPEEAEFAAEEVADFEYRLALLRGKLESIREWCSAHLLPGHIGKNAWDAAEELRRYL